MTIFALLRETFAAAAIQMSHVVATSALLTARSDIMTRNAEDPSDSVLSSPHASLATNDARARRPASTMAGGMHRVR